MGQMSRIKLRSIFGIQKRYGRKQLRKCGNRSSENRTVQMLSVKQDKEGFHHTPDRLPVNQAGKPYVGSPALLVCEAYFLYDDRR